jgi:hypothetical protein
MFFRDKTPVGRALEPGLWRVFLGRAALDKARTLDD